VVEVIVGSGVRVTHAGTTEYGIEYLCRENHGLITDVIAERAHRQAILATNFRRLG